MLHHFVSSIQRLFSPPAVKSKKSYEEKGSRQGHGDVRYVESQWKQHAHVKDLEIKELMQRNEDLQELLKKKNAEMEDIRCRHRDFYLWQDYFTEGDALSMDEVLASFHIKNTDLSAVSSILYLINKNLDRIQDDDLSPKSLDNPTQITFAAGAQSSLIQLKKDIAAISAEANSHTPKSEAKAKKVVVSF